MLVQNQDYPTQHAWQMLELDLEIAKERSAKEIKAAGDVLRSNPALYVDALNAESILLVTRWRSSHESAMKSVMRSLQRHARVNHYKGIISGREKRLRSIAAKLNRQPNMALNTMQDIAGCRIVLDDAKSADAFASSLRVKLSENPGSSSIVKETDYIRNPKADGYRSIHFVMAYKSANHPELKARRVEVQIRSQLQHRWATALEAVDLFTGQTLKSGGGDPRWRRFFALASSIFAFDEQCSPVPGMPISPRDGRAEMRQLANDLYVVKRLQTWSSIMKDVLENQLSDSHTYLIELDAFAHTTRIRTYAPESTKEAHKNYVESELSNSNQNHRSSVLVKAYSFAEVRQSFPGYYGDTKLFLKALNLA